MWLLCFAMWLLLLCLFVPNTRATYCDRNNPIVPEGNLGQTLIFPWLGVLRVHIREGQNLKIAVTGLILIKTKFGIVNSDDISRLPSNVLKESSRVMFIVNQNDPWYCKVKDFINHPEYEILTVNTMSLVELRSDGDFWATPVCWSIMGNETINVGSNLYAVGYTDENMALEKTVHKLQYVEKPYCDEFYTRTKLINATYLSKPVNYKCTVAVTERISCLWDNGVAITTNVSGYWMLVGFGLQGPGCAAPSRFLDLTAYASWIDAASTLDEVDASRRKNTLDGGSREPKTE